MRRILGAVLVATSLGAVAAHAEDSKGGWKWDARKWARGDESGRMARVGETTTEEGEETVRRTTDLRMPGHAPERVQDVDVASSFRLLREVSAVQGTKVTGLRVNVDRFQKRDGTAVDRSLAGKTVSVSFPANEREAPTARVTDERKGDYAVGRNLLFWLATHVTNTARDERLEAVLPEAPVKNDEEWTIDPRAVAAVFFADTPVELDAAASSCKGKLTKLRTEDGERHGHVEVTVKLQLASLPGGASGKWTKGGLFEWRLVFDGSLERGRSGAGSLSMTTKLGGAAEVETPKGRATFDLSVDERTTLSSGRPLRK